MQFVGRSHRRRNSVSFSHVGSVEKIYNVLALIHEKGFVKTA